MDSTKTLMIIDDDVDDRFFFSGAVKEINPGYVCREADEAESALAQLRNSSALPDYIFLDINMPLMSGVECLRAIKSDKKLKKIPVIIYSTSISERTIAELRVLGASEFLNKLMDISRLPQEIIAAMKKAD